MSTCQSPRRISINSPLIPTLMKRETQLPPWEPQWPTKGRLSLNHYCLFLPGTQRLQWPPKEATYSPTQTHLGSTPLLSSFRKHTSESKQSQGLVWPSWITGGADENWDVPGVTDCCVPVWEQEREGQRAHVILWHREPTQQYGPSRSHFYPAAPDKMDECLLETGL